MKIGLISTAILFVSALANPSSAQVTLSFIPLTSTTIAPGGTVTFDVNLTITEGASVLGDDYFLQAPASTEFTLLTFDDSQSIINSFGPPTSPNGSALNTTSVDLGALSNSYPVPTTEGTYLLSTITLQASNSLPGARQIYDIVSSSQLNTTSDWIGSDGSSNAFTIPASLDITVQSAPEPSVAGMVISGIIALVFMVRFCDAKFSN